MRRIVATLLLLVGARVAAAECALPDADRAFLDHALATWEAVRAEALHLPAAPLPLLIVFDEQCVWRDGVGSEHPGTITLLDGNEIPAAVMTFASSHDGKPFLVMALPSLWRAEPRHRDNPRLEQLIRSVFVHEMTHTRQAASLGARLEELEKLHEIENLNDDLVQARFASRDGFKAAFEKERDLLFAIAEEKDAKRRRTLATQASRAIRERRARYFTGAKSYYAELEEIFLGMEGVANWAGVRAAMHDGLSRADAIDLMRGSRKWFSQEEGLALFLAIDALKSDALESDWQKQVMGTKVTPAFELLR